MPCALIVHAHPEPQSFCSALKSTAQSALEALGYTVSVSDLYAMGFHPADHAGDFATERADPDYFKYQLEQLHAAQAPDGPAFSPLIAGELEKLEAADLLVFNFPLWWFHLPAILKGWVDRVFAMGAVYGGGLGVYDSGRFKGRRAFLCFTTGGPEKAYGPEGRNGELHQLLYPIHHGILYFAGYSVLPPFVAHGPARLADNERTALLDEYRAHLGGLASLVPLYGE